MFKKVSFILMAGALIAGACTPKTGIEITHAWTRSAPQGGNGAVYFTIVNHDAAEDALLGATADFAEVIELHETRMVNDVMEMRMVESIPLPAGERVELAPGGLHAMLINLSRNLEIGETVNITLHFRNHPDIPLTLTVQAGPDHSDHDD